MRRILKHLLVLTTVGVASLFAYNLTANALPASRPGTSTAATQAPFSELSVAGASLVRVENEYVDPARIDYDAMFDAALDAVEREIPEVLFHREPKGELLTVNVGSFSTTLTLAPIDGLYALREQLSKVADLLDRNLDADHKRADIEYALVNGMLSTLDPHTLLLVPVAAERFETDNAGRFGGLGISIKIEDNRLTVEYPMPGTPAAKAGLEPGDRIIRIDGESTINMDINEAVSKLRGPVGSKVTIRVERGANQFDKTLQREEIKLNEVKGILLEGGIGYIEVKNFHQLVTDQAAAVLATLETENGKPLRGLILDLRGNPGGYLDQAVGLSDLFLSGGVIVSTVDRNGRTTSEELARRANEPTWPIVVLVDGSSASASEIVAGALKESGRAVIIGEQTFGKGSVQHLYPASPTDGSQLKLTVARYMTPGDKSIQGVGVPPDIELDRTIAQYLVDEETGKPYPNPTASMYYREHVLKEADLSTSLTKGEDRGTPSIYRVRYLATIDRTVHQDDNLHVEGDWEVEFSRQVLMAAPAKANRAETLAAVGKTVTGAQTAENERIIKAFGALGLDWSPGVNPQAPPLRVEVDVGPDGVLDAGKEELVTVRVTNTGTEPVHQLLALSDSSLEFLDNQEFFFGRVDPGKTRSWTVPVELVYGYREEVGRFSLALQDADGHPMGASSHELRVQAGPLPRYSWTVDLYDGTDAKRQTKGDGDGVPEPGEVVALHVVLTNVGPGAGKGAFVTIKNKSGKDLDLQSGSLELGAVAPKQSVEGDLRFQVKGAVPELQVEMAVGDQDAFDYNAVVEGGFIGWYTQHETLTIPVGTRYAAVSRLPPEIEVTRRPPTASAQADIVLSGVAKDADGVKDVVIYHRWGDQGEEEKVFYQGGAAALTALPFTVDATLKPGTNLFVVLVEDELGNSELRSVTTWYAGP